MRKAGTRSTRILPLILALIVMLIVGGALGLSGCGTLAHIGEIIIGTAPYEAQYGRADPLGPHAGRLHNAPTEQDLDCQKCHSR